MRRPDQYLEQFCPVDYAHAQATADKTTEIYKAPADRALVVDRVLYVNPTGLAADDTNYAVLKVTDSAGTVIAQYSTKLTGGDGALTADTLLEFPVTAANAHIAAAGKIKFTIDVTGAPTVPAGSLHVEGRLQ